MRMRACFLFPAIAVLLGTILSAAPPTIFLAGDSDSNSFSAGDGGVPIWYFFNPAKVKVADRARAGASSRTFFTQGYWQSLVEEMKAGRLRAAAVRPERLGSARSGWGSAGIGEETREVATPDGKHETVHTYGWYMRDSSQRRDPRTRRRSYCLEANGRLRSRGPEGTVRDVTHTGSEEAESNAAAVVAGLKALPGNPFGAYLARLGRRSSRSGARAWC